MLCSGVVWCGKFGGVVRCVLAGAGLNDSVICDVVAWCGGMWFDEMLCIVARCWRGSLQFDDLLCCGIVLYDVLWSFMVCHSAV
jgi:hypothetical protein